MNSETKLLVKLVYIEAICNDLIKKPELKKVYPTAIWMAGESVHQSNVILDSVRTKQGESWCRVANRCVAHLKTLAYDYVDTDPKAGGAGGGTLHMVSVLIQMLEDCSEIKNKGHVFEPLLDASYSMEALLPRTHGVNTDYAYACAKEFLNAIYVKINES